MFTARGTTAVERYKVTVLRSTTYSPTYSSIRVGVSSSWMTSLNNVTGKPLTPCSICAPTLNQVWLQSLSVSLSLSLSLSIMRILQRWVMSCMADVHELLEATDISKYLRVRLIKTCWSVQIKTGWRSLYFYLYIFIFWRLSHRNACQSRLEYLDGRDITHNITKPNNGNSYYCLCVKQWTFFSDFWQVWNVDQKSVFYRTDFSESKNETYFSHFRMTGFRMTGVLLELSLPAFDTVVHNSRIVFAN